ncbi:hypothetical protein JW905_00865, partial [bacterium]|nr:hypothetical protein [candidate division CSSED10-310 bacterium]
MEREFRLVAVEHWKPTHHDEHYKIPGTTPLECDPNGVRMAAGPAAETRARLAPRAPCGATPPRALYGARRYAGSAPVGLTREAICPPWVYKSARIGYRSLAGPHTGRGEEP